MPRNQHKYLISFILVALNILTLTAQNLPTDYTTAQITAITSASSAAEGDLYHDYEKDKYYIGATNGELLQLLTEDQVWLLSGNTGTDPAINFLGTTDNKKLVFKTFNEERVAIGELGNDYFGINSRYYPTTNMSGSVHGVNQNIDLQSGAAASNVLGIENLLYARSGSTIRSLMRAQRNRLWNISTANYDDVVGVFNDYRGESTDIQSYVGFDNFLNLRAGSNITNARILSSRYNLNNGNITNFYGVSLDSYTGNRITNYYGFFQGNLGTANNRFAFLYDGDDSNTQDVAITGEGKLGLGTQSPSNTLEIDAKTTDESGLTFTQLDDESSPTTGAPIGVDANGKVVTLTQSNVYMGYFTITSTGNKVITGLPFSPTSIQFTAQANVDDTSTDDDSTTRNNDNSSELSFGTMTGFAQKNGASITQLVTYVGGHGASINDISRYSELNDCIGVRLSNNNGENPEYIKGTLTSFDANGFTINITEQEDDIIVIYTAYR